MSTSPKKEKSVSKSKDKPPKDTKTKKSKEPGKAAADNKSKDGAPSEKSKKSKVKSELKSELNQSQMDISLLNPGPRFLQTTLVDESICTYHKEKNTLFCETCEQPGCQSCTVFGPHNSQLHRTNRLEDSYKARYLYLNQLVCGGFIAKRDRLNEQIKQLDLIAEQLRFNRMGIEKITKIQFSETLERLKGSSGSKLAVLHHQMAALQRDLEGINALGTEFFELTNTNPDTFATDNNPKGMVPFLLRSKQLQQDAEELIAKPIKTSIDVYPYDLPREVAERKLLIQTNESNAKSIQFKNEVIWRLVEQKKAQSDIIISKFYQEANNQCEQWNQLTKKLADQVKMFDMTCEKCRVLLSEESVNGDCSGAQGHHFVARHA